MCFVLGYTVAMNPTFAQAQTQVQALSAHVVTNLPALATSLPAFASDFLVVLVLVASLFFFSRYAGRGRFVAFIVSLYTGYALYKVFPFANYLPSAPAITALTSDLALFSALCIAVYVILRRIVVSDFIYIGTIGLIILSFLTAGFLLALAYQVFPVRDVYTFTPAIDVFFATKSYFFWWFIAPLVGLFVFAR